VTGARIWVDNRVDLTRTVNLFVAEVILIISAGDYTVSLGGFSLNGITMGTIVLYQLFKGAPDTDDFAIVGDSAEADGDSSQMRASTTALRARVVPLGHRMLSQRIEGGEDGKDADDELTDWEAASVERICANADLVAVKPAVAIAVRDPGVRAERGFVRVQ
jgi:hypothetical protein